MPESIRLCCQSLLYPHAESNCNHRNRNPVFYPLNYGGFLLIFNRLHRPLILSVQPDVKHIINKYRYFWRHDNIMPSTHLTIISAKPLCPPKPLFRGQATSVKPFCPPNRYSGGQTLANQEGRDILQDYGERIK